MKKFLLLPLAVYAAACACRSHEASEKSESLTIVVEADRSKLVQQEADLRQRMEEYRQERERLRQEQERLLTERGKGGAPQQQTEQLLGKVKEIFEKERRLWERERKLELERQNIEEKKEKLGLSSPGQAAADPAAWQKEAKLAEREASLAGRERQLAEREKQIAEREAALARREAEFLATQARLAALPAGRPMGDKPVTAAAAQKAYATVLGEMRKKGILVGDLPPEGETLLQELEQARKQNDYSKVSAVAEQIQIILRTIRVDAAFLDRKFQRLAETSARRAPSEGVKAELGKLQRKATTFYSDGKFLQANSELNRMFSLLGEK